MVYKYYVAEEGGYVFNFDTGKLRCASGHPIDLALLLTCRVIAEEMEGIALQRNTVTFRSEYSEAMSRRAARFQFWMDALERTEAGSLGFVKPWIVEEVRDEVGRKFPFFKPTLQAMRNPGFHASWPRGEVPSLHREAVTTTMRLAVSTCDEKSPGDNWWSNYNPRTHGRRNFCNCDPRNALALSHDPWAVPTEPEIDWRAYAVEPPMDYADPPNTLPFSGFVDGMKTQIDEKSNVKCCFSAAAVAVWFLASLPRPERMYMRRIVLLESRVSVAHPECHARGLIPFCRDNPLLRVERRVELWRNAFQADVKEPDGAMRDYVVGVHLRLRDYEDKGFLAPGAATRNVAVWIQEALALAPAGMPPGSFSLVFDGDPTPEHSSWVFETVVFRDAGWQAALDKSIALAHLSPSYFERRDSQCYISEAFPQAVRDIVNGTSVVRCNFPLRGAWDDEKVEELITKARAWTIEAWSEHWDSDRPHKLLQTSSPLPTFLELLRERVRPNHAMYGAAGYVDRWELEVASAIDVRRVV